MNDETGFLTAVLKELATSTAVILAAWGALGGQNEVHRKHRRCEHLAIRCVVTANTVGAEFGSRWHGAGDTEGLHIRSQPAATMAKLRARDHRALCPSRSPRRSSRC